MKKNKSIRKIITTFMISFSLMLPIAMQLNSNIVLAETTTEGSTNANSNDVIISSPINDVNVGFNGESLEIGGGNLGYNDAGGAWNALIKKFKFFVAGVSGIGTIAMILFFIYNFIKLASTSDNDAARAKVIKGLVWSAIAAAGLGAVTIFVGFFYNAFRNI